MPDRSCHAWKLVAKPRTLISNAGRRTKLLEASDDVVPATFARAHLLQCAIVKHAAVRKNVQRSRRRASEIAGVGRLVDGPDVTAKDWHSLVVRPRQRIAEAHDSEEVLSPQQLEASRKETKSRRCPERRRAGRTCPVRPIPSVAPGEPPEPCRSLDVRRRRFLRGLHDERGQIEIVLPDRCPSYLALKITRVMSRAGLCPNRDPSSFKSARERSA
jgi:hypothetical protein